MLHRVKPQFTSAFPSMQTKKEASTVYYAVFIKSPAHIQDFLGAFVSLLAWLSLGRLSAANGCNDSIPAATVKDTLPGLTPATGYQHGRRHAT